jgi:hypothetical protein
MTFGRLASLAGIALLVLVLNVTLSILYMVVYSYVIDPGHDEQYYSDHIQVAAPYCSIVAGIPLMFAAGWWVSGWWGGKPGVKAALLVWLTYFVIDFTVVLMVGFTAGVAVIFTVSFLTKLVAAYLGAVYRGRRSAV